MSDYDGRGDSIAAFRTEHPAYAGDYVPTGWRSGPAMRWLCVYTESGQEMLAEIWLRRLGLCTWLPAHKSGDRIRPLFGRYLFVQADLSGDLWRKIYSQPGVVTVLGMRAERPTAVPAAALEILWSQCGPSGIIYPPEPLERIAPADIPAGTAVKLVSGRFVGLAGICRLSATKRVEILLSVLGGERVVSVPREQVLAA